MRKVVIYLVASLFVVLLLRIVMPTKITSALSESSDTDSVGSLQSAFAEEEVTKLEEEGKVGVQQNEKGSLMNKKEVAKVFAQKYVEQQFSEKIKLIAANEGETFAQTLSMFPGQIVQPGEVEKTSEQIVALFEEKLKESLLTGFSQEMTSDELQELAIHHQNPKVDLLNIAKLNYQAQLLEGKDDKDLEKHHKQLFASKEEPARIGFIDKIDELLGETSSILQQSIIATKVMQGEDPEIEPVVASKQLEDFKKVMSKLSVAYYSSLSDQDLQDYISLLENHPILIKEQKIQQRSIRNAVRKVAIQCAKKQIGS